MSKKVKSSSSGKTYDLVDVAAFIALLSAAVIFLVSMILSFLKLNQGIISVVSLIKDLAVFAAISLGAWCFVKNKKKGWRICYWISFALYLICMVLGVAASFI